MLKKEELLLNNNDFTLDIIAGLNKQLSKAKLKNDLKGIDNTLSVKVIAKLATALSKKQLWENLKQLNNLYVQVGQHTVWHLWQSGRGGLQLPLSGTWISSVTVP